ncbi:MAG: 5'/3'-nucleotidase SurE [Muribaculaceae bacterium]|nr:5'/3'-nucleotidase SurE [Muribaculaceae bacterium]
MNDKTPIILVSNDDGINAPGLRYLIQCISGLGRIIAVAPDAPRSGQSSAITVESPLRITKHEDFAGAAMYSVNGTPVDCIKLAMHTILPDKPDIMVCGINHGSNAGNSVLYSGTMGAVMEACTLGIPAIGYSLLHHSWSADFSGCTTIINAINTAVMASGLPQGVCMNVNIPARCVPKGIKVVRAARGYWTDEYRDYTTPSGAPFYWLTGRFINQEPDSDETDLYWLDREYATVVPVSIDQSATGAIPLLKSLEQ